MSAQHAAGRSRREFLGGVTVAGAVGLLGLPSHRVAAEPPPETTTLRLTSTPAICLAPQYVAAELLQGEGFTEVQYVKTTRGGGTTRALAAGEGHISTAFSGPLFIRADAGDPIVLLAGVHVGCFQLFGTDRVRAIRRAGAFGGPSHRPR
jgi:NitT/TauT family transport system substrate-binding protein